MPATDDAAERQRLRADFDALMNMSPAALERWLATPESRAAGWKRPGETETVGHRSGRRILAIRRKHIAELDADDYRHMRRVIGFCRRHLAQGGPARNVETSRWRRSLMNWGHDPLAG